jgi:hypothetical protein
LRLIIGFGASSRINSQWIAGPYQFRVAMGQKSGP